MKRHLERALELAIVPLAAAIVFFEQTLIRYLNVLTEAFGRWPPVARLEARLVKLSPWPALFTFVAPSILILPIKVIAFWLALKGHYLTALVSVILGKLLATAILARLYRILRPTLMQLRWFAWADTQFFYWRDQAYAFVKSLPAWQKAAAAVQSMKVWLTELLSSVLRRAR
ncbi:MAG TPA: hypothetical protein VMI56_08395 [Reyranella sp.]|nr:hypothetical protein [Reyranella sp.]